MSEFDLLATNTLFQKRRNSLWTWRSPTLHLSQIDFILCRKRWRNSIHDAQAHSSSNPIGSDHRIVTVKVKLSLRIQKTIHSIRLNWKSLSNPTVADVISHSIDEKWNTPDNDLSYKSFIENAISVCQNQLPKLPKQKTITEPTSIT